MRRILARMTGPARGPSPGAARRWSPASCATRGITDERVLAAMGAIPREAFVPDEQPARRLRRRGPADRCRPDDQPAVHGRPDDRAPRRPAGRPDPRDRHRVRLPGGDPRLARCRTSPRSSARPRSSRPRGRASTRSTSPGAVEIREADGSLGDPAGAPWDGIIVTAAAPAIPHALRDQLAEGGRLVIPVGSRDRQLLTVVTRHGNDWLEETDGYCVFVPLIGAGGFAD